MTTDIIRFVDSVSPSAAVRLDLNDEAPFMVRGFLHSPARLVRAQAASLMRGGVFHGASSYGGAALVLDLDLPTVDQDRNAEYLQRLARELDRETNWVEYRPNGATFSVFFKTYRADFTTLADVRAATAFRQMQVEIPCDPHALGALETVTVGTVNNNPAAGSNGCYFDVTGVKGDVAAPMLLADTETPGVTNPRRIYWAVRQTGSPEDMPHVFQAESGTLGTDTTNPGGGPDAAMSGTGTNNYVRCSFATTATMDSRVSVTPTAGAELAGRYRMLAAVRRSSATGIVKVRAVVSTVAGTLATGDTVTTPTDTNRNLVDLGIVTFPAPKSGAAWASGSVTVQASRETGTSTLDFDCFHLVPADSALTIIDAQYRTSGAVLFDGLSGDEVYWVDTLDPFGTAAAAFSTDSTKFGFVGAFPMLQPGITNRFIWIKASGLTGTSTLSYRYHPHYTRVKPLGT